MSNLSELNSDLSNVRIPSGFDSNEDYSNGIEFECHSPNRECEGFLSEIDFPLPKFVLDNKGICPNWILPLDQMSFGVELERYDINSHLRGIGRYHGRNIEDQEFPSFLPSFKRKGISNKWKVEEDGSLGMDGCEFVSPVLYGSEGINNVCNVMDILKRKGFSVDQSCGIHVHIGLKGIVGNNKVDDQVSFLSRLVKSMFNYQGSFFGSCGKVRRDRNRYSRPLRVGEDLLSLVSDVSLKSKGSKSIEDFSRVVRSSEKYRCLNISKLRNSHDGSSPSSSIEFRFPEGEINKESFLLHLVQILWLVRQSWIDRHGRMGRDKVSDNWNLDRKFQKKDSKEGINSFNSVSKKIQNSPFGKWLRFENENIFHNWNYLFQLWESKSIEFDEKFDQ